MKKWIALLFLVALVRSLQAGDAKQLTYGRIVSVKEDGLIVACEPAKFSHPTGFYGISDSTERVVHVAGDPDALRSLFCPNPSVTLFAVVGHDSGTYTYKTETGEQSVPNVTAAEKLPAYGLITPARTAASGGANSHDQVSANLSATAPHELGKPSMELPHYNTMTSADLRPGISADQVLRILGKPQTVNYYGAQQQWCYLRGQVYVEHGVATAFQNFGGDVVAASWK
jgi:hypothetical protein